MEVILLIHPLANPEDGEITDYEIDSENYCYDQDYVPAFVLNKRIYDKLLEGKVNKASLEILISMIDDEVNKNIPRLSLDIENMEVLAYLDDVIANLNLDVNTPKGFGRTVLPFTARDATNEASFTKTILNDGYLEEESNYFSVDERHFSIGTSCTMLRNSRVILCWRKVELSDFVIKKMLSSGLLLLLNNITKIELAAKIKAYLPKDKYELSIKHKVNSYVLIVIEPPVFTY